MITESKKNSLKNKTVNQLESILFLRKRNFNKYPVSTQPAIQDEINYIQSKLNKIIGGIYNSDHLFLKVGK